MVPKLSEFGDLPFWNLQLNTVVIDRSHSESCKTTSISFGPCSMTCFSWYSLAVRNVSCTKKPAVIWSSSSLVFIYAHVDLCLCEASSIQPLWHKQVKPTQSTLSVIIFLSYGHSQTIAQTAQTTDFDERSRGNLLHFASYNILRFPSFTFIATLVL